MRPSVGKVLPLKGIFEGVESSFFLEMLGLTSIKDRISEFEQVTAAAARPGAPTDPTPLANATTDNAIAVVATPAFELEVPQVKTKEVQIKELRDEWKGTIRSLWSRSIQIFTLPDGSWKLTRDVLTFKTPQILLSGDSRRSPSPQHLLVWLNPNLKDATAAIDMIMAWLTEPFKGRWEAF